MITFKLSTESILDVTAQGYALVCQPASLENNDLISKLQDKFYPALKEALREREFKAAANSSLVLAGSHNKKPVYLMFYGVGDTKQLSKQDVIEYYRRAMGHLVRSAEALKISSVALQAIINSTGIDDAKIAQETATSCIMAAYHFDEFIGSHKNAPKPKHEISITVCVTQAEQKSYAQGIERGTQLGIAINKSRRWCDLPGNYIWPQSFAQEAQAIAKARNLKITIFGKTEIQKMGMGGIDAVSAGSAQEPQLVVMEYKTSQPNRPTIGLVGKGVTFDSGGLSLKPAVAMETMKDDMAGAASVIASMDVIGQICPSVNIVALAPMVENMPSGTATRPGDIIRFYNGKTAEVKNTDAEGRLILADALSYAVANYKLDAIIDLATLTGACAAALGPFYAGLMGKDQNLIDRIKRASETSGDRVWQLPFHDDYKAAIRSDVADICNIGSDRYKAGAITAGFFLYNFVDNVPWAHLDIAGTAFHVPDMSYYRVGSTGFGIRLLVDLIENWD